MGLGKNQHSQSTIDDDKAELQKRLKNILNVLSGTESYMDNGQDRPISKTSDCIHVDPLKLNLVINEIAPFLKFLKSRYK